jgi:hypothetical protein
MASSRLLSSSVSWPFHHQAHLAMQHLGKIADDARKLGKDIRNRLHAGLHHRLAQVGGDHVETARKQREVGVERRGLQYLVAGQHQFADQIHHAIEQHHIHAQRAVGGGGDFGLAGF